MFIQIATTVFSLISLATHFVIQSQRNKMFSPPKHHNSLPDLPRIFAALYIFFNFTRNAKNNLSHWQNILLQQVINIFSHQNFWTFQKFWVKRIIILMTTDGNYNLYNTMIYCNKIMYLPNILFYYEDTNVSDCQRTICKCPNPG